MRWLMSAVVVLSMTGAAFGQVTLDFLQNADPGEGFQSFTVRATGVGINTLGWFNVIGDVHQVWTEEGVQSEWLNNGLGTTPDNPMDSQVVFGDARLADLPNFPELTEYGPPYGPMITLETLNEGGTVGLGTLSNVPLPLESASSSYGDAPEPPTRVTPLPGDANLDRVVDRKDIAIVAHFWGTMEGVTWFRGDFDSDGVVGPRDASILGANWESYRSGRGDMGVPCAESSDSDSSGLADAYLMLGDPGENSETVDLMQLVLPANHFVSVELELFTIDTTDWPTVTSYQFVGEGAISVGVPEPSALALLGIGALAITLRRWRRRRT